MAGTLSIVATPIGHLDDITVRALNVLRAVQLIAAEDTRRTARLLAHFGIQTPTLSFHEHNARSRVPGLVRRLQAGDSVALVSDAGTPVLSDPGLELIQACIRDGLTVDPVPGASAPLALGMVSGFPLIPWTIHGFPPTRAKDRMRWLAGLAETPHTVSFLEAPHRMGRLLGEMAEILDSRPIAIGRELTKIHQTVYRGTASNVSIDVSQFRGEFTIMLGPAPEPGSGGADSSKIIPDDQVLASEFFHMTNNERSGRRRAIKALAERHGLSAGAVYAAVERVKVSNEVPS